MAQYGCWNNVILSGIPNAVSDDTLEESEISILAYIDIFMEYQDTEVCHRFGKAGRQKSKKTIIQFVNRRNCKKVLSNKGKLGKIDSRKHNFSNSTKLFASENLKPMNEDYL